MVDGRADVVSRNLAHPQSHTVSISPYGFLSDKIPESLSNREKTNKFLRQIFYLQKFHLQFLNPVSQILALSLRIHKFADLNLFIELRNSMCIRG